MALKSKMLLGMNQLDMQAVMLNPVVTMDGEPLSMAARALIWADAVDAGYTDPAKVISDYNLTSNSNLSTCIITTLGKLREDFADIQKHNPDMYKGGFEEYWENFPIRIKLPDDHWIVWCE